MWVWLKRIERVYRRRGAGETVKRMTRILRRFVYTRDVYYLVKRDLAIPCKPFRMRLALQHVELREKDIDRIDYVSRKRKTYFREHLRDGSRWYGSLHEGRVVFFVFAAFRPTLETDTGYTIQITPDQVYMYDGETDLAFRGKGVAIAMMEWFWNEMKQLGAKEIVSCMNTANRAACRFHQRLQFEPYRVIERTRVIGFRFSRVRDWDSARDAF